MTEAQRTRKKQEKKAQKKVTYAELQKQKRLAKERKEKYDAEEELYPLTAEITGRDGQAANHMVVPWCNG